MEDFEKPKSPPNNLTPNTEDVTSVANETKEKKEVLRPNAETEYAVLGLLMSAPKLTSDKELLEWNSMFEAAFKDADQVHAIGRAIDNDISRRIGDEWDIDNGISSVTGFLGELRAMGYEESDSGNSLVEKTKERVDALIMTEVSFSNRRWIIAREYMYQSKESYRARTKLKEEIEGGAK